MGYDPQVIKEITPCSKRKNHASIRARDESAEAVSARIRVCGGDEDCLAPLQLSFRRPCSSLVFFGGRGGLLYYLLASDFDAMMRHLSRHTNPPPSPTSISIPTTPIPPPGIAPFFAL